MTDGMKIKIEEILPHRYPFLLVDKILELEPGRRAVGQKNVTRNEYFFNGHFPGYPVMPGVLMVEALAQVGAVALLAQEENRGKIPLFTGIEKLRFKRQVVPGDVLRLEMEVLQVRGPMGRGQGTVTVDGEIAVKGELLFYLAPSEAEPGV
jgi:3-hydroxyacyl-[acyl-carrier-protein] dehydratase